MTSWGRGDAGFVTVKEAAAQMGASGSGIEAMARDGVLRSEHVCGVLYVQPARVTVSGVKVGAGAGQISRAPQPTPRCQVASDGNSLGLPLQKGKRP